MLIKLRNVLLALGAVLAISAPALVPSIAHAQVTQQTISGNLCSGSNGNLDLTGDSSCATGSDATSRLSGIFTTIVNIFSVIVGIVAVIMIIYGGLRYVISGGDSNNVSGAKNTIIFAIVGLIVVALAQVLVHFVLSKVS